MSTEETLEHVHFDLTRQTLSEELHEEVFLVAGGLVVAEGHSVVVILIDFLQGDLHEFFDALVGVLVPGLFDDTHLEKMKHLLPGDVSIAVHVVNIEAERESLVEVSPQEDTHSANPFLSIDLRVVVLVEGLKDTIHDDVVGHVEAAVKDTTKGVAVHLVPAFGFLPEEGEELLVLLLLEAVLLDEALSLLCQGLLLGLGPLLHLATHFVFMGGETRSLMRSHSSTNSLRCCWVGVRETVCPAVVGGSQGDCMSSSGWWESGRLYIQQWLVGVRDTLCPAVVGGSQGDSVSSSGWWESGRLYVQQWLVGVRETVCPAVVGGSQGDSISSSGSQGDCMSSSGWTVCPAVVGGSQGDSVSSSGWTVCPAVGGLYGLLFGIPVCVSVIILPQLEALIWPQPWDSTWLATAKRLLTAETVATPTRCESIGGLCFTAS